MRLLWPRMVWYYIILEERCCKEELSQLEGRQLHILLSHILLRRYCCHLVGVTLSKPHTDDSNGSCVYVYMCHTSYHILLFVGTKWLPFMNILNLATKSFKWSVEWVMPTVKSCPTSVINYIWVASRNHGLAHIADFHIVMVWVTTDLLLTCSKFDLIWASFAKKLSVECMHPIRHFICTCIENSIQNGGLPLILHWKCCFCCRLGKYQLFNHGYCKE